MVPQKKKEIGGTLPTIHVDIIDIVLETVEDMAIRVADAGLKRG